MSSKEYGIQRDEKSEMSLSYKDILEAMEIARREVSDPKFLFVPQWLMERSIEICENLAKDNAWT